MIKEDEYLERLVAGIQAVTTQGADVTWNETLNARQFDVVVRFKLGTLRYLVLVEVKNRSRKASAEDMDAFANKSNDQRANKSVFVNVAGYQPGAIAVARRHGIDVFTVAFDHERSAPASTGSFVAVGPRGLARIPTPAITFGLPRTVNHVPRIELVYADGMTSQIPDEPTQMAYYCERSVFERGSSLESVVREHIAPMFDHVGSTIETIRIDPPERLTPPDEYFFPGGLVAALKVEVTARDGTPFSGPQIDATALQPKVSYKNALTDEAIEFELSQLPLGTARASVGKFYCLLHPLRYYYCERIVGEQVVWFLVESFQNGVPINAVLRQSIRHSRFYIPVSDRKTLNRLSRRLEDFRAMAQR